MSLSHQYIGPWATRGTRMDHKDTLIRLWKHLKVPGETIEACSKDYDLLCPHCLAAGRGEVHLKVLKDDTGFQCIANEHRYRTFPVEEAAFVVRVKPTSPKTST